MDMGNICDAPNSAPYKNPGVSRQSACEIAGTSRFQASNKFILKYCTKTFSNKRKKGSRVSKQKTKKNCSSYTFTIKKMNRKNNKGEVTVQNFWHK
jgi:hypothetical protein